MRITFFGAAQEVTGSMHLVEVNNQRILLDCGMFQGHRADTYERNLHFGFDPAEITVVVLSHAHIDHSGDIPNLVKQGYQGNIWCTPATRNLCAYMLMDSAHIQEQDAAYLNEKQARAAQRRSSQGGQRRQGGEGGPAASGGSDAKTTPGEIQPLYTQADAQAALTHFVTLNRHRPTRIADGVDLTFYEAGHILGSAFVQLDIEDREAGKTRRLIFSGDIGRPEIPIVRSPEHAGYADFLLIESTYGDRLHGTYTDARRALRDIVRDTVRRRGKLVIPAFAVGRTQEIVYALNELDAEGAIPPLPIFVDSPLAVNATDVFRMHPEEWDDEVRHFLVEDHRSNPFDSQRIEYVRDVRRSKQLNYMNESAVIISASGMAESGRILHHLANNIERPENTILFVGFQAQDTLGRRLMDGLKRVHILGDECDVRARIASIDGYSAHADQNELLEWAATLDRARLQQAFVVHGEPASAATFADKLRATGVAEVTVPQRGQTCAI